MGGMFIADGAAGYAALTRSNVYYAYFYTWKEQRRAMGSLILTLGMALIAACIDATEINAMTTTGPRASRLPPVYVAPVTIDGVRYAPRTGEESVDGQAGGILGAYDAAGQLLWTLKVYDNRRQPGLEGDVQDVFFSAMTLAPYGRLRIVNERGDIFLVDVNTRTVTALPKQKPAEDDGPFPPPPSRR